MNADLFQAAIVVVGMMIMPRRADLVDPLALLIEARSALESGKEKALEHKVRYSWVLGRWKWERDTSSIAISSSYGRLKNWAISSFHKAQALVGKTL
jgi:hypothetical protein